MKKLSLFLIALAMILVSCKPEIEKPTVVTKSVGEVTETSVKVVGQVTADGGAEISERGVCWNTTAAPEVIDYRMKDVESGLGIYEVNVANLLPNTTYYVRAYATNEKGVSYGEEKTFTTLEVTPEEPGDEPEEPGDEPEEPGDEPEEPGDDPEEPGDEPEEPGDEPEEPGDEPELPGDEPEEPGDEPEEPGDEPEEPGEEPEEPGDEPEEPGDEPEEPGEEPEQPGDEPEEPGDFTTAKCVLLEDYIGVRCNNCPAAGEIALQLQEQYGHRVVVLSVHAGFLAYPIGGYPNFTTPEGTEWYSFFGFDCNPVGTVNRKRNGGVYAYSSSYWTDAVVSTLQEEATVAMTSNVEYDEASRNLKVDISSKALVELPDIYTLTVCIMEDSIVGKQVLPTGVDDNYVHRHVFRKTINGTWGEELNTIALAPKDVINRSYSVVLDEAYNADQCYIIAYIANIDTKEVLQVIEKKIK